MSTRFNIHPVNPQARLLEKVCEALNQGKVVAYPTDSTYAVGCLLGEKQAMKQIRELRHLGKHHDFSILCRDLSSLSHLAQVDNPAFRCLKQYTPGPYTFILTAAKSVSKYLDAKSNHTIGLRVPSNPILQDLLGMLDKPLVSVSLIVDGDAEALSEPDTIEAQFGHAIDIIIDGGPGGTQSSSIIDLTQSPPTVIRHGAGDTSAFES